MKLNTAPAIELGWISVVFQTFFMVMLATILFFSYGIEVFVVNQLSAQSLLLGIAFVALPSVSSFIIGLVAMLKNKDRNLAVVSSVIIGGLVVLFLLSYFSGVLIK